VQRTNEFGIAASVRQWHQLGLQLVQVNYRVNFPMPIEKPLGSITQGSLSKGLEVRLHADVSVEEMRVGKFLVVRGTRS
jgi:hypothetical protein